MDTKNYRNLFIHWASMQDNIHLIAWTGDRVNSASVNNPLHPYQWILGVEDVHQDLAFEELGLEDMIQCANIQSDDEPNYHILFKDRTRFEVLVKDKEDFDEYLNMDSLSEVVLDKNHLYGARPKPTDLAYREVKPEAEEIYLCQEVFFKEATALCMYLYNNDLLPGQLALERLRKPLLTVTRAYCGLQSEFTVNLGTDLRNLKVYLTPEWFDHLSRTFSSFHRDQMWDALFQACMLFRKCGLALDEKLKYSYPRDMDVAMLKLFRSMWEEVR